MLTKNFLQLQTEVQCHVEADRVRRGSHKTCFIGDRQRNSPEFIEREYGIPLAVSRIAESIFEGLPSDEAPLLFAAFPDAIESDGKDLSLIVWQFFAAELRSLPPVEPGMQAIIDTVIDGIDLLVQGKEWSKEDANAAASAAEAAARAASAAADAAGWAASAAANAAGWAAWAAARAAADAADAGWAADWAASAADWAASAANAAASAASAAAMAANPASSAAARVATRRRQRDLLLKLIKEVPITRSVGVSSVALLVNETHD